MVLCLSLGACSTEVDSFATSSSSAGKPTTTTAAPATTTTESIALDDCYALVSDLSDAMRNHAAYGFLDGSKWFGAVFAIEFGWEISSEKPDGKSQAQRAAELELVASDFRDRSIENERLRRAVDAYVAFLERRSDAWERLGIAAALNSRSNFAEAESLIAQSDVMEDRVESLLFHPEYDWSTADDPDLNPDIKQRESVSLYWVSYYSHPELDLAADWVGDAICGLP